MKCGNTVVSWRGRERGSGEETGLKEEENTSFLPASRSARKEEEEEEEEEGEAIDRQLGSGGDGSNLFPYHTRAQGCTQDYVCVFLLGACTIPVATLCAPMLLLFPPFLDSHLGHAVHLSLWLYPVYMS